MKLLVLTQAVDLDDPVLGFFHRWLEELARHLEQVHVICLKEGRHTLPGNVAVYSLGKEHGRSSRVKYAMRFYSHMWSIRREYDAVFVHMNEEYAILGGPWWRFWGKKIVLWRNHKIGSWATNIACMLSHSICYTSPEAYVALSPKAVRMPIGIDTQQFAPPAALSAQDSILFLGRLDKVKNPDVFIAALDTLSTAEVRFHADFYGSPTHAEDAYARTVKESAEALVHTGVLTFHPAVSHDATPSIYSSHAVYVNLTPSGSFDKTIGEAMASGCLVVAANAVVKDVLGELFVTPLAPEIVAERIRSALSLSEEERNAWVRRGRIYIEQEHSLSLLVQRLSSILAA